jgi:small-conductance mechanosensitive channel
MLFALNPNFSNWMVSLGIAAGFVALAFVARFLLRFFAHRLAAKTKTILDDLILEAITPPIFIMIIAGGVWIGVSRTPELVNILPTLNKVFQSLFIIITAFGLMRLSNAIVTWYGQEVAIRTETDIDDKLMPLLKRVITAVIFIFGAMLVLLTFIPLSQLSPLLAGLGIGGLAVALALQPTLSNFLAGTYVMSDAIMHKGDYIQLDSGQEGFIEDIGWRTTKLRHWQGNMIVMPNAKLSDAIVMTYEKPEKAMSFSLDCGVAYGSDLEKVEQVTLEVARNILQKFPEGVKDFEPSVRYKQFGDSNINFAIVLKSIDRSGQFVLKHEFIKALSARFQKEGIDIQYPVRKLVFADKTALLNEGKK